MLLTVELPDGVVKEMPMAAAEIQAEVRREVVVALYARGVVSLGKAVELADLNRADFEEILAQRHIERPYTLTELERDLAWAKREA
jgi:predicted HTH domain antitoxin